METLKEKAADLKTQAIVKLSEILKQFPDHKFDIEDDEDFHHSFSLYHSEDSIQGIKLLENSRIELNYVAEDNSEIGVFWGNSSNDYMFLDEELSLDDILFIIEWFEDRNLINL